MLKKNTKTPEPKILFLKNMLLYNNYLFLISLIFLWYIVLLIPKHVFTQSIMCPMQQKN